MIGTPAWIISVAAVCQGRHGAGSEIVAEYVATARERVLLASQGLLKTRPIDRPVYEPPEHSSITRRPPEWDAGKAIRTAKPRRRQKDAATEEATLWPAEAAARA